MKFGRRIGLYVLVFSSLLLTTTGCLQGPTGAAGKDGKSVTDTIYIKDTLLTRDSSFIRDSIMTMTTCSQCHFNNQLIVSKQYEWEMTKHDTGTTWVGEGSNAACIACHNGNAFIFKLSSADSANVMANPTNANCRTCHKIHTKYDTTDFALVGDEQRVVSKNNSNLTFPDYGAGNLCVNCHQLRTNFLEDVKAGKGVEGINPNNSITSTAVMVGTDSVKFTATASRASMHYGAQAEIVAGAGLYLPNGGASLNLPSAHRTAIADGCVDCHMGSTRVHTYQPQASSCASASCHPSSIVGPRGKFDIDSVQTKTLVLAKQVRDSLVSRKIATWDTTKVWPDPTGLGFGGKGKTFPVSVVGAYLNLGVILWDGSKGVHNPKFVNGLLTGSIADLKK